MPEVPWILRLAGLLVLTLPLGCDDPVRGSAEDASAEAPDERAPAPDGRPAELDRDLPDDSGGIADSMPAQPADAFEDAIADGIPWDTGSPDGMADGMADGIPSDAAMPDAAMPDAAPVCTPPDVWTRGRDLTGGVVVFSELMIDPVEDAEREWVELVNTLSLPVDLSGWRLEGAVRFTFPAGTLLAGGERRVVARDPALLELEGVSALGPYDGRLARRGERLELFDRGGRRMDTVRWRDEAPWPVPDAASGRSLVKRDARAASPLAEHWSVGEPGGTPGVDEAPGIADLPRHEVLIPAGAAWRLLADAPGEDWTAPDADDGDWSIERAPLFAGQPPSVPGRARFTADNHFAVYVGGPAGEGLRLLGRDAEGAWQTAEAFAFVAEAGEHLYVAAWEAPGDSGSPQMLIGTHTLDGQPAGGTTVEDYEALLGPPGVNPGGGLEGAPPAAVDVAAVAAAGGWAAPRVSRGSGEAPWGPALGAEFGGEARYLWLDTFDPDSLTNQQETYALFRTRAPLTGGGAGTELAPHPVLWLRADFDFAGDPAESRLVLDLLADDGAVVWLNGVEVHRRNVAPGPVSAETRASAAIDPVGPIEAEPETAALQVGRNVLAVALVQAEGEDPADLRFDAELRVLRRPPLPLRDAVEPAGAVVISEIMYHPAAAEAAEWIELHNPGAEAVDLSDWALVDGVGFVFPEGAMIEPDGFVVVSDDPEVFARTWPEVPVLGPWDGGLSNRGERLRLLDGCGAVVDDLRVFDGGRWPEGADGHGPSLVLREPRADNGSPDAWTTSGEIGPWQVVEYRGEAQRSPVGPDGQWQELVLGLLDGGAVLLDDITLIEDPDGAARPLVGGGDFEGGLDGWRALGTHGDVARVPDPDDPGNTVLRLRASGATEHMHNHLETTLLDGAAVQDGTTYAIRLRARWLSGSNQLNTRLYFNRLARTTRLARPERFGTPGWREDLGPLRPTFSDVGHAPVVPAPDEPIRVAARVHDPDGIAAVRLWWALDGEPFAAMPMVDVGDGRHEAQVPGHPAGALVQFYVEAEDALGAVGLWPRGGAAGRALVRVEDEAAREATPGLSTLRLLMTAEDDARLHQRTELMSNHRLNATLVVDEARVHYGVGVRAKGSQRGRPTDARFGFSLRFDPARPFRGVYESVSLDRSEGTRFGQREVLIDAAGVGVGLPSAEYNDVAHLIAPRGVHTGPVALQLARFGDLLLDNRFDDGGDGMLYEYELVYYPLTTDDGTPTGRKLPQPDRVVGTNLRDLGEDPEGYRHTFLVKNNRARDDFGDIIAFAQVFGRPDAEFRQLAPEVIDVDQWLEAFAFSTLVGAVDQYAAGSQHNVQFYVRPADGRVLFFPHDLDFFPGDARRAVVQARDLRRLIAAPQWRRDFYRHLRRMIGSVYNGEYLAPWAERLGALLPDQDFAGHLRFIEERARYVMDEAPDGVLMGVPPVPFAVDVPAAGAVVPPGPLVVEGTAWLDVRTIWVVGAQSELTWIAADRFRLSLDVEVGDGPLRIEAIGDDGQRLGSVELPLQVAAP